MAPEELSPADAAKPDAAPTQPRMPDGAPIIIPSCGVPSASESESPVAGSETDAVNRPKPAPPAALCQAPETHTWAPEPLPPTPCSDSATPPVLAPTPPPAPRPTLVVDRRELRWPLILFALTCVSTYSVGAVWSDPFAFSRPPGSILFALVDNVRCGLGYMAAVMSILLAHEMGHFLQAVRYRVPAGLPIFLPLPITPLGTLGAVIRLRGLQANRKELFDIGLTGPLAGLLLAIPMAWIGIRTAEVVPYDVDGFSFGSPLLFKLLVGWLRPEVESASLLIHHANPLLMASWVGMLVTGLNMLPIGQLDGGHVTYALLGKQAHWLARLMILAACIFIIYERQYNWSPMLALVVFFGIHHPPTGNDRVQLGRWRTVLGWVSLAIPIFCLTPFPVMAS